MKKKMQKLTPGKAREVLEFESCANCDCPNGLGLVF